MQVSLSVHENVPAGAPRVAVPVDRHVLQKRRWRTNASDGTDIAVDFESPCRNGAIVHFDGTTAYYADQQPERIIRIPIPADSDEAARLGWFLGNQHLPVEIRNGQVLIGYDRHLEEKLLAAGLPAEVAVEVFSPDPHSRSHHHH